MGIENDINQPKFASEYQKAAINIIYTNNWLVERFKNIFESEDLTTQQFNILRILRGAREPLSICTIRERMLDRMSDASRIVDRLIKKGLVKKTINKFDKRLVSVTISPRGLAVLKKLDERDDELNNVVSKLSVTEAKTLNKLLDKIRS
ncbi:MAG: MarR family transcriptional regulator [Dinghuibacter sp.]|nr:MarR family transcriptional regulator [Dinghuibacter sp.]